MQIEILCAVLYLVILVTADDGSKYCPDVINKDETTFVIGDSCYHYQEKRDMYQISHGYAVNDCKSKGAYLMTIPDERRQNAIFKELDERIADSHTIMLGLQKHGSVWKWPNGMDAGYTNWKPNMNNTQNCARMTLMDGGDWETFDCSLQEWYPAYVCEYNKHSASTAAPISSVNMMLATALFLVTSLLTSSM